MSETLLQKRSQRSGDRSLVTRQPEADFEVEILKVLKELKSCRCEQLPAVNGTRPVRTGFDVKAIVAICAIVLSIAGYVIQDARNSSRLEAEIEMAQARLTSLERISSTNSEARVRTEVQLTELREGQMEIKRMLEEHDLDTKKAVSPRR